MKSLVCLSALALGSLAFATPSVSNVQIASDAAKRTFAVTYDLADGPAIVTVELATNGVAIGREQYLALSGDVNRKVVSGSAKTIRWNAGVAAPGVDFANVTATVSLWDPDDPPEYMAADLITGDLLYYVSTNTLPGGIESDLWRTDRLLLKWIPVRTSANPDGTTFQMLGQRYVKMTKRYYMATFELTQKQWERVMMYAGAGTNAATYAERRPSWFTNESAYPTRIVDGTDYVKIRGSNLGYGWPASPAVDPTSFMGRLRALTGSDRFDLPTDAQWEYAYRAGTTTSYFWGTSTQPSAYRKYMGRSKSFGYLMPDGSESNTCGIENGNPRAGSYEPNPWGIYDLPGGTWEYTLDWWEDIAANTAESPEVDRRGPARTPNQTQHPARGGCSMDDFGGYWGANGRTAQSSGQRYLGGFHVVYRFDDFDYTSGN